MITIFNKREIITTFDIEERFRICDVLSKNGISYREKVFNALSGGLFSHRAGGRRCGTFGINKNFANQYTIYVKRKDYHRALRVIDKIKECI